MSTYQMTEDHKSALAEGRRQSWAVRHYLEALETTATKTDDTKNEKRLEVINSAMDGTIDPVRKLELLSEKERLVRGVSAHRVKDVDALREGFIKHAAEFAERKDISYRAFRELGVPSDILKEAGISK